MTSNRIQNAILRVKIKIEIIQPNQIEMINAAISSHSSEHL